MASPLNWFRRNAIWIMVPVGIFCMAFFGLGAVFEQFTSDIRTGGTRENPVLATWKNGTYSRDQVNEFTKRHYGTARFLGGLERHGRAEREDEFVRLVSPVSLIRDGQQDYVDEQIISRHLMAEKAKEEGLLVSEAMIDDYLAMSAGGAEVTPQLMKEINRDVNGGRVPMAAIRRQLEVELLNQKMMLLSMSGLPRVPNLTESVEHFGKTARKIECQVIPVSVSDYVDDSLTPTQSELRAIYEEGKLEFKDPRGQLPGFKTQRRVKMQYFAGNFENFLVKASASLTDKEIQAQYDELVEQESDLVMEIIPDDQPETPVVAPAEDSESAPADDADDPAPVPSTETPDSSINVRSSGNFQFVSMIAQEGEPVVGEPVVGEPVVGEPVVGEPVVGEPVVGEPVVGEPVVGEPVVGEPVVGEPVVGEPVVGEPVVGEPVVGEPVVGEPVMEKPVVTDPVTTEPAVEEKMLVTEGAQTTESKEMETENVEAKIDEPEGVEAGGLADMLESADEEDEDVIGPLLGDDEEKTLKRAKPLKEVASLIRRQLKGREATEAMRIALITAETEVETYNQQLLLWDEGKNTDKPKPTPPDFQAIADQNGLRLGETELLDNEQLRENELGKTMNFTQRSVDMLADMIFDRFNTTDVYEPTTYNDGTKAFVYWPIEMRETEIPNLEDCKEEITKFYRQKKAFETAQEAAQAIAAKATVDMKLTQIDPDKAAPTGEFSWFQVRGRRTVFSQPIGVELAGEEFMKTAFSLKEGEAGVAANRRRDIIYVVQSISPTEDVSVVGGQYLNDQLFKFQRIPADVGMVNAHYYEERQRDWNQEYVDSMDFDFMK